MCDIAVGFNVAFLLFVWLGVLVQLAEPQLTSLHLKHLFL